MSVTSVAPTWSATAPLLPGATLPPAPTASDDHDALRPGTRLDEFEIVRVLGAGGFGIVYLALDHVLLRYVAIKEYMPTTLAGRGTHDSVAVRSAGLAGTFAIGLESFFNEARLLAGFDHPSLVKVYRFWKANGTAYMVMPYYPGHTLKEARLTMHAPPDQAWLRAFVEPLLGALELLHGQGVYHRDIAPDNILLLPDGRPVLLDFGSARRVIGDRTQSLTAILKPNFAPVEQYADEAGMRQGPWTDLYSLGATVYFMLTGQAPTPAVLRAVRDSMPALSASGGTPFPGVSTGFLATIDWTLALAPDERPQSVAAVRKAFRGSTIPPAPSKRHGTWTGQPVRAQDDASDPDGPAVTDETPAPIVAPRDASSAPMTPALATAPAAPPCAVAPAGRQNASLRHHGRAAVAALALTIVGAIGWGTWAANSSPAAAAMAAAQRSAAADVVLVPVADETAPTRLEGRAAAAPAATPLPRQQIAASAASPAVEAARGRVVTPKTPPSAAPVSTAIAVSASAAPPATERQTSTDLAALSKLAADARPAADTFARHPKDACESLNIFSRALCVVRECQAAQWRSHPHCVEARRTEEQRQRRMDQ